MSGVESKLGRIRMAGGYFKKIHSKVSIMKISVQEFLVIERQKYLDSFQSLQSWYAIT